MMTSLEFPSIIVADIKGVPHTPEFKKEIQSIINETSDVFHATGNCTCTCGEHMQCVGFMIPTPERQKEFGGGKDGRTIGFLYPVCFVCRNTNAAFEVAKAYVEKHFAELKATPVPDNVIPLKRKGAAP